VDPDRLDQAIQSWVSSHLSPDSKLKLAIDGKTVRAASKASGRSVHCCAGIIATSSRSSISFVPKIFFLALRRMSGERTEERGWLRFPLSPTLSPLVPHGAREKSA